LCDCIKKFRLICHRFDSRFSKSICQWQF